MKNIKIIKKAFNDGYLLQKLNPELAVRVAKAFDDPSHVYAKGFISGAIEYITEKGLAQDVSIDIAKNKEIIKSIKRSI